MILDNKNYFTLKAQDVYKICPNIVLNSYGERVAQKKKITHNIAIGSGSGELSADRTQLFNTVAVLEAEIVDLCADVIKGAYILRRTILPKGEYVGTTITEIGFADEDGVLITHAILDSPITKGEEELEITGTFFAKYSYGILGGENSFVKCLLGERSLEGAQWSYVLTSYKKPADAQAVPLESRVPIECRYVPGKLIFDTPVTKDATKTYVILYLYNEPVIISRYYKLLVSVYAEHTLNENATYLKSSVRSAGPMKDLATNYVSQYSGIRIDAYSQREVLQCEKTVPSLSQIYISKDKQYLVAYDENSLQIFYFDNSRLIYLGEIRLNEIISKVLICYDNLFVLCNEFSQGKLYRYKITPSSFSPEPFVYKDIYARAMDCGNLSGDTYVLFTLEGDRLIGRNFDTKTHTSPMEEYINVIVGNADYLGVCSMTNAVFCTKLGSAYTAATYHRSIDKQKPNTMGTTLLSFIVENKPDKIFVNNYGILALNTKEDKITIYSYTQGTLTNYNLRELFPTMEKYYTDGYVFITTRGSNYKYYNIVYNTAGFSLKFESVMPFLPDDVYFMSKALILKNGEKLYEAILSGSNQYLYNEIFRPGMSVQAGEVSSFVVGQTASQVRAELIITI